MNRIILGILMLASSCQTNPKKERPEVALSSILQKCVSNDTSVFYKLDTVLDFKWDRMLILTPYFNRVKLKNCGFLLEVPASALDNNETPVEYLFIKEGKILKYLVYKKDYSKIMLTFDPYFNFDNSKNPICGLENQDNTYIKLIPNAEKTWDGRTYLIFHSINDKMR